MKKYLYPILLTFLNVLYANAGDGAFKANESDSSPLGYICEGTVWELATLDEITIDPDGHFHSDVIYIKEWIEGTEEIGEHTYMKVWEASSNDDYEFKDVYYIRTEQEKVYQLNPKDLEDEFLLFDFSLAQGEEIDLRFSREGFVAELGQATCVGQNEELYNEQIFKSIDIKLSLDEEPAVALLLPTIKWINGIGSESGILDNYISPEFGGYRLLRVLHNGEVVYRPAAPSEVEQIAIESISVKDGKRYHIDGREFNEGDTGICIQNGKKTIVR